MVVLKYKYNPDIQDWQWDDRPMGYYNDGIFFDQINKLIEINNSKNVRNWTEEA